MAMNFDPMTGEPINPTPVQPQPQMAFDPMTGMPLQQPPKKKKKTGLIAGIVAGVVVIAGACTVFAGIQSGFFLSKSDKVLRATANTFREPSHFTEALSGLSVMSSKAYTVDIKGEAEGYSVQRARPKDIVFRQLMPKRTTKSRFPEALRDRNFRMWNFLQALIRMR